MERKIRESLKTIFSPDSEQNIVESGLVEKITANPESGVTISLLFKRTNDPFAKKISREVKEAVIALFPEMESKVKVFIKEQPPITTKKSPKKEHLNGMDGVKKIIAIAAGKGGVGKSTVASNLAVTLAKMGYRVALLDTDLYGPSQPRMFGLSGQTPKANSVDGVDYIVPQENHGVKINSIGFFLKPDDALMWRGPIATNAIKQLVNQTEWGEVDYLILDLPPGSGDIHLSILQLLRIDGAIIVTTPQKVAIDDNLRGVDMFRNPNVNVPILGVIENMAWFTPEELPDNRYYLFGKGGGEKLSKDLKLDLLGQIPLIESVMSGGDHGVPSVLTSDAIAGFYKQIAEKVVDKVPLRSL